MFGELNTVNDDDYGSAISSYTRYSCAPFSIWNVTRKMNFRL